MRREIRFAGYGGQGVISQGVILGYAACIESGYCAVQTQSYGPESRGGTCHAEVIIADSEIHSPVVADSHVLVTMSPESFEKFRNRLHEDGMIVYDSSVVFPCAAVLEQCAGNGITLVGVDATAEARRLGNIVTANIVMLGGFTAMDHTLPPDAVLRAVLSNVPNGTKDLNKAAFARGLELGRERCSEAL